MDSKVQLLEKIHQLEKDIWLMKSELNPKRSPPKMVILIRSINDWFRNYFPFISAIAAGLVLLLAYFVYGVDPLQSYRDTSEKIKNEGITKQTSNFYVDLGETLLKRAEFKSAEKAFQSALEIKPTRVDATVGILRSQIFKPLEGEKYYKPEVVEAKLVILRNLNPDDYVVHYSEGILHLDRKELDQAKLSFKKAAEINPAFVGSDNMLGLTNLQAKDDISEAISNFTKGLAKDPHYAETHGNLGTCYLLTEEFDKAIEHLETSYNLAASPFTALMLGDAYLYKGGEGSIDKAFRSHQRALTLLEDPNVKDVEYISSTLFNYMPEKKGDRALSKNYVYTNNSIQNKAFARYAISFDYALLKRFPEADAEFAKALALEHGLDYLRFFQWKMVSLKNFLSLDDDVNAWFTAKGNALYDME